MACYSGAAWRNETSQEILRILLRGACLFATPEASSLASKRHKWEHSERNCGTRFSKGSGFRRGRGLTCDIFSS